MKKLFSVCVLSIILVVLNQGYSQPPYGDLERPILIKVDSTIIMQNNWISLIISMKTGEISTFYYYIASGARNLLTETAGITIRDKRGDTTVQYQQFQGKVVNIEKDSFPPDSVQVVFDIDFYVSPPPPTEPPYSIQITYTLDIQAFHWDAILKTGLSGEAEANIDFSFPAIANMDYAFWTKDGAPFKLTLPRTVTYRGRPVVLPALILYNDTTDIGLSFVSPFELRKPGLRWEMKNDSFVISNYYLRLSTVHPCRASVYIVPHEADWRPGLAWIYNKYDSFFNPVSQTVLNGEGWHAIVDERPNDAFLADLKKRGVNWVEYFHFPFYGLYAPCAPYAPEGRDSWNIIADTNDISYFQWLDTVDTSLRYTTYDSNNTRLTRWRDSLDIQTYLYFQSFESWIQYADEFFPLEFATGANGETLPAWRFCYLMNPDPDTSWGKYIISQIGTLLDKYPNIAGIFYDRDDYCDYAYNYNDGVTMIDTHHVYMLGFAQEKINDSVLKAVHEVGKGVWTNQPTSIEVCKNMDGIMSEALPHAPYQQYLGINRPLILEPYDKTPQQTEEKLKTALWSGHFPSVAWIGSDPMCLSIDSNYRPLFSLYKGKKWVLSPHALQLPEGIRGNIFQTPAPDSDYLVPMIDPERYSYKLYPDSARDIFRYDRQVKLRVPDSLDIKYCYIQSGDYKGINQDTIFRDIGIEINIPAHRVSTLIQLSKEPRYEVTRISSPALTRRETEKVSIKFQNIGQGIKEYKILLSTNFGTKTDSFSLGPRQTRVVSMDLEIPGSYRLGEDTMKVVERNRNDTTVFTSWVVDLVTFQIPEKLFVHFIEGESIPFTLVNNTDRTIRVNLIGSFKMGQGTISFNPSQPTLEPFAANELLVFIKPIEEEDTVMLFADDISTLEPDSIKAIRPIERAMKPEHGDIFDDNFSSRNMNNWDIIYGKWDAKDSVAKNTANGSHLAFAPRVIPAHWDDFKFQVNTMLKGSIEPPIDWLRSLIYFRVQDTTKYYCFGFSGWSAADEVNLYKREGNKWSQLATYSLYPYKIKKNVWYNLKVEVKRDSIKGFLDGNQVVAAKDTTFRWGRIGIGVLYESMRNYYDDVVVRELR